MKKQLIAILLPVLFCITSFAQNTFPSSGPVMLGAYPYSSSAQLTVEGYSLFDGGNMNVVNNNSGITIGNGGVWGTDEGGMYGAGDDAIAIVNNDNGSYIYAAGGMVYNVNTLTFEVGKYFSTPSKMNVKGSIFCDNKIFIGTADATTPAKIAPYALAVNGDAIFNKVKVKLYGNWPDYVFNNDYQLPSLADVEKYIKANKHLPDVKSVAEVDANGIDVGETQAILLKKIEELTLYMVDMNKKIETLAKENKALRSKVDLLEPHK